MDHCTAPTDVLSAIEDADSSSREINVVVSATEAIVQKSSQLPHWQSPVFYNQKASSLTAARDTQLHLRSSENCSWQRVRHVGRVPQTPASGLLGRLGLLPTAQSRTI